MKYDYPILNKVISNYLSSNTKNLSSHYILSCQHFLEPQIEVYKGFIKLGIKPENISALGKIYSTNFEILKELNDLGIKAIQPIFTGKAFDEEHKSNCLSLLDLVPNGLNDLVVLDDGGELIKIASENNRNISFAVEQTSSGFRKLENLPHGFPVINVARSKTKLTQESPLIARHCFERITKYAEKNHLVSSVFVVIGLGPIGESLRQILVENNFKVTAYDKNDYISLTDILSKDKPNIVIGATGNQIISSNEVEKLPAESAYHFVSVSSSDREFPVAYFRNHDKVHEDVKFKNVTFVNNGFPINFMGNRIESTPIEIEKTLCLLFGSVAHGLVNGYKDSGLIDVPKELESLINS